MKDALAEVQKFEEMLIALVNPGKAEGVDNLGNPVEIRRVPALNGLPELFLLYTLGLGRSTQIPCGTGGSISVSLNHRMYRLNPKGAYHYEGNPMEATVENYWDEKGGLCRANFGQRPYFSMYAADPRSSYDGSRWGRILAHGRNGDNPIPGSPDNLWGVQRVGKSQVLWEVNMAVKAEEIVAAAGIRGFQLRA